MIPLSSAQFSGPSLPSAPFTFDPQDLRGLFSDSQGIRTQSQLAMKASIKDFKNSQQTTQPIP